MKYILTSDLHIHPHFNNHLFIDVGVNYLKYIHNYCKENQIPNIFFLGDIFHISNKINIEIFIPIFEQFEKMSKDGIKMHIIPGNHELLSKNNKTILEVLKPYSLIHNNYHIIDENLDLRFHFLPFAREVDLSVIKYGKGRNILFAHLDIAGFKMTEFMESKGLKKEFLNKFDFVFTGHFHAFQQQKNIVYIGSPYQQNFGEENQKKGFIEYSDDNTWRFIEYDGGIKFRTLSPEQSIKEDLTNTFLKLKIDKKIDNLSKLREILVDKGALNITQDFEIKEEVTQINQIKISKNNSLADMLKDFISQDKKIESENLDSKKLLKILDKILEE